MGMTKSERTQLADLVRRKERVLKAEADQVAAARLADFEQQAASDYLAEDDTVWREQAKLVDDVVADAQRRIAERNRELGIPEWAAPSIAVGWYSRGQNASKARVAELRKIAQTRVAADAKAAKLVVERWSVDAQTELVSGGLESAEAQSFLAAMPTMQALMPSYTVAQIEGIR